MAMLAPIMAIGSSVVGGIAKAKAGRDQAQQYADQAALSQRQAQDVDTQAKQMSAARRANLEAGMATIEARRAASNVGLDSPTAQAIENNYKTQSRQNENAQQVGYDNQRYALLAQSAMQQNASKSALAAGRLGALGSFMNAGNQIAGLAG